MAPCPWKPPRPVQRTDSQSNRGLNCSGRNDSGGKVLETARGNKLPFSSTSSQFPLCLQWPWSRVAQGSVDPHFFGYAVHMQHLTPHFFQLFRLRPPLFVTLRSFCVSILFFSEEMPHNTKKCPVPWEFLGILIPHERILTWTMHGDSVYTWNQTRRSIRTRRLIAVDEPITLQGKRGTPIRATSTPVLLKLAITFISVSGLS